MTVPSPLARATAARLWARFVPEEASAELSAAAAAQLHVAMRAQLHRWIGADGYRTLYGRAHVRAHEEYPTLAGFAPSVNDASVSALALRAADRVELARAIECLLAHVVDLLARIIGTDMAVRLVDQIVPSERRDGPRTTSEGDQDG